ncbi:MAG: hypothetical protein M3273_00105 [Actinomycetota bacterium]|nr:hypothetical protein [Actinomycetota bacterium]
MSVYAIKPWFVRNLRGVEDALVRRNVSPDALSCAAFVSSVAGGGAIAAGALYGRPLLWLAVPPLCVARLALNALDGSVARRTGAARPFGIVVNEVGDRLADAALVGSLATVADPALTGGAVAGVFLCSLTGVLAQLLTGTRATSGPMGKADRVAVLAVAATAAAVMGSRGPFEAALVLIAGGSLLTAGLRISSLRREVDARAIRK